MSSIEQYSDFHMVRRILNTVEPSFRLVANPSIIKGGVVLDCDKKTIEVGEGSVMMEAVAAMIFCVGQLFLKSSGRYKEIFGDGVAEYKGPVFDLINKLISDGTESDQLAMSWSVQVLQLYWNMPKEEAEELISRYVWSEMLWEWHFSGKIKH